MRLFFETASQANRFLAMVPLGFVLALCLDADGLAGRLCVLMDCLVPLAAGAAVLCTIVGLRESGLRAYHLLGLLTGAVLYLQGAGRLFRILRRSLRKRRSKQEKAKGM